MTNFHVVYPGDYFKPKLVDEMYRHEAEEFADNGWTCSTTDVDKLASAPSLAHITAGSVVMYRGWMLNESSYTGFTSALDAVGATPLTSTESYLATHHIPRWYPRLSDFTAETVFLCPDDDLKVRLQDLGWEGFFVKDFVKSLKTSLGSVVTDVSQIDEVVSEMQKYRGTIEGGLSIRRLEAYEEGSERRYFVVRGIPFDADSEVIPDIVAECARRIESPLFTVDVACRTDGETRVVEIGDGQVSDLVGWDVSRFVEVCTGRFSVGR